MRDDLNKSLRVFLKLGHYLLWTRMARHSAVGPKLLHISFPLEVKRKRLLIHYLVVDLGLIARL
jgi:hypothetical protein